MSSVLEYIKHYQKNIERCTGDEKRVLRCIDKLDKLPVTVQHLQDTGVGRTVNALRKDHGEVGKASKALVAKWKLMVAEEEESDEEPPPETEEPYQEEEEEEENNDNILIENEVDQRDFNNHSPHEQILKSDSDKKRKYEEKTNEYYKRTKVSSRDSVSQKKYRSDSDASDNMQYKSSHNSHDSDSNNSGKYVTNKSHEHNDDSDMENKFTNYKHEKTKINHSENGESHKSKTSSQSCKEKTHHKDRRSSVEIPRDKHRSKSAKDQRNEKRERNDSTEQHKISDKKQHRHSSDSKRMHDSRRSSSSSSKSHSDSKKSKEISKSVTSKTVDRSHSSKSKEKESKNKDDKRSNSSKYDRSKTDSKNKDQSAKPKSTEHKDPSLKTSTKPNNSKKEKKTEAIDDDGIGFESGTSFAEALGMITHSPTKKKSSTSREPSNKQVEPKKPDIKSPSDTREPKPDSKPSSSSKLDAGLLSPDFKLGPLPPIEISALPEISPNYKPRPPPKLLNSFHSEEEALKSVMLNKNQRTKVYSGNKVYGTVPSLYELCVIILQEHIDALEYTGGVPYDVIKPVVDKSTPDQLFMLEHYNPYLMEDTDHLWQKHCERKFRTQKRQELESWRDMYMRCLDEQEAKLKSLTANIKMSQDMRKAPTKMTKMAYVDSAVKPPRGIARKQAIYGTAKTPVVSPAARVASLAAAGNVVKPTELKGAPSSSESSTPRTSGFIKPKKAPLMQKALQFMKGRLKR